MGLFDELIPSSERVALFYVPIDEDGNESEEELLKIDCTTSENIVLTSTPTEHEVEDGSVISDHVTNKESPITLTGIVTDYPITLASAAIGNVAGASGSLISDKYGSIAGTAATGLFSALGNTLVNEGKPSLNAYKVFKQIREKKIPIKVVTGLDVFENMIMTNLNINRTASTATALHFTASFKKIVIAQSETVQIPDSAIKAPDGDVSSRAGASKKRNLGKTNPKETTEKVSSRGSSVLASFI